MLNADDLKFLRGLSVFAGLASKVVENIGQHARRVEITGSELLFKEGDPAKEMVVVLEGRLEVVKRASDGREAVIATLGPGAVAGEMSLIDIQPRSADVRSSGPASLVVLTHGDLASIYHEDPKAYVLLVMNIAREISLRLRRLDNLLASMLFEIGKVTHSDQGDR